MTKDELWESHRAYLRWQGGFESLLDPRFYTLEWLNGEVESGRIRCWDKEGGAILATLKTYPTGAVEVHGMAAVGCLASIKNLIPFAEQWGCQSGAIVASIASRAGWSRALISCGYAPHQTEIVKDLTVGAFE